MFVTHVATTVRSTLNLAREKEITFLAASVAFYAFFSVLPAMMLMLITGSILGGEALAERIISFLGAYLSSSGEMVVNEALTEPPGYLRASTAGFLALMWSALKVFHGISIAFDRIYQVDATTSLLQHLIEGVVVLLTTISALGLMVGLGMVIGRPDVVSVPYIDGGWLALVTGLLVVFLPLYYVMSSRSVSIREILSGTLIAVSGWLLLQVLFQVYAVNAVQYQVYGFVGAVLLFMLWLYLGDDPFIRCCRECYVVFQLVLRIVLRSALSGSLIPQLLRGGVTL